MRRPVTTTALIRPVPRGSVMPSDAPDGAILRAVMVLGPDEGGIDARADDLPLSDASATTRVVRGGGALSWPWQGADEWVECASAYRRSEDDSLDGGAACRFVRRLSMR